MCWWGCLGSEFVVWRKPVKLVEEFTPYEQHPSVEEYWEENRWNKGGKIAKCIGLFLFWVGIKNHPWASRPGMGRLWEYRVVIRKVLFINTYDILMFKNDFTWGCIIFTGIIFAFFVKTLQHCMIANGLPDFGSLVRGWVWFYSVWQEDICR